MNKKIVNLAFEVMSSYPEADWQELYLMLFEKAYKEGDKKLAKQAFYKIITEAIRTKNTWAIEELTTGEDYIPATKELNLYSFGIDAIKVIIPENTNPMPLKYSNQEYEFNNNFKYQFREGNQHNLCSCCHDYVLSCEEIQNFPIVNEENYIREKFHLALSQEKIHKRIFIIERLLKEYSSKLTEVVNSDFTLLFELWTIAEKSGIHVEPISPTEDMAGKYFIPYFQSFLTIVKFRHHEHDLIIDDVIELMLKQERYNLALYLNAKLSTPYKRLFFAIRTVLSFDGNESCMCKYLQHVVDSVKNEEVKND